MATKKSKCDKWKESAQASPRTKQENSVADLSVCSLSPILFEEYTLEKLWTDTHPVASFEPVFKNNQTRLKFCLKELSLTVKETVKIMKKSTYKDVLLHILNKYYHDTQDRDPKWKANLQRRVYDILNILVASNVLIKQDEYVKLNLEHDIIRLAQTNCQSDTRKQKLSRLTTSYIGLKNIIERNHMQCSFDNNIKFPFFVIAMPKLSKYDVTLKRNKDVCIDINGPYRVLGPDAIFEKLGLFNSTSEIQQQLYDICNQ